MTNNQLKNKLQAIADNEINSIEKQVALEALDSSYENPKYFFELLFTIGCVSGMVNSLIWYVDTHAFFDTHYNQIEELRNEYEDNCGIPFTINNDLKNALAWFAFEEVAYKMAQELGLEI